MNKEEKFYFTQDKISRYNDVIDRVVANPTEYILKLYHKMMKSGSYEMLQKNYQSLLASI